MGLLPEKHAPCNRSGVIGEHLRTHVGCVHQGDVAERACAAPQCRAPRARTDDDAPPTDWLGELPPELHLRILEGVDEHHLALDVLDDSEQKRRPFFRTLLSLAAQKIRKNVVGCGTLFKAQITRLLQQGNAQSCLANAVQGQGQENPVEHLVRVAHHRLIILLLTHDGCKVTSYF